LLLRHKQQRFLFCFILSQLPLLLLQLLWVALPPLLPPQR
jgi:hypothetical protein